MNAEILKQLNAKSKEKLQDCPGIISFDCGSYGCPFLEYLFPHLKRCTRLMLLHEWRDAKTNLQKLGTLETNKEYVRTYFENPAQFVNTEDYSETLHNLATISWSRQQIFDNRTCLVMNALLGVRERANITAEMYKRSLEVWLWLVNELRPERIYLAGSWAYDDPSWFDTPNRTLSLSAYLSLWKGVKNIKLTGEVEGILCQSLPHPSNTEGWKAIGVIPI